jgi:hypothetical protein
LIKKAEELRRDIGESEGKTFYCFSGYRDEMDHPGCALFFIIGTDNLKLYYRSLRPFIYKDNPG